MRTAHQRFILAITAATLLLVGTPAEAQLKKQKHLLELGLYVGPRFMPTRHDLQGSSAPQHESFDKVAAEIGLRFGYLPIPFFGAELELGIIPTKVLSESSVAYGIRAHVIGQYPVWKGLTPFVVVGGGVLGVASPTDVLGKDADAAFHWGVGLKYYLMKWISLRLDFRHTISDGIEEKVAHHFSLLAGVSIVLNWEKDTDKDGIPDGSDHCPKRPGKAPSGCPDTDGDGLTDNRDKCPKMAAKTPDGCPLDADKDGISDDKDKCPKRPGKEPSGCPDSDRDGLTDNVDKCPKVAAKTPDGCPPDRDKDGILDAKDQCPDKPGKAPTGCPDSDGDGVVDIKDKCPKVPARTPTGCPLDSDGDGFPDTTDKCPNKPENINGYQDLDGCPDKIPIAVRRFSGTIRGIRFAYNKAKIRRRSFRLLRKAAKILVKYGGLRIKIRGHTDNRGKLSRNINLSLRRAQAVKDYLVKRGVGADRLVVEGVGPKEPIAKNSSRRGRAKNRRIEFQLIK